jgi:RimJ/RimL family protein N-acetyltransferase
MLSPAAMAALVAGDVVGAGSVAGEPLSGYLASPECTWLWEIRLRQLAVDPSAGPWVARAAVVDPLGVVGHGGFHGPPDAAGLVEVGYQVDPVFRRRGFGRAMLVALVARAAAEPRVRTVRASIAPGNAASLAMVAGCGFVRTGEQVDEVDGVEWVFELAV